ncbi:hypothetical protein SOASR029_30100 [Budvicia aquatica]|nr:hypothetical protein SOASR029_30100 [Budvicia aquatica]
MNVKFVSGDIFSANTITAFAHGCNCAGAMGKGIAVEFKKRWPKMYAEYHRLCKAGEYKLGDVFVWHQDDVTIFNLGTQAHWTKKAELSAIEKSVSLMLEIAKKEGINEIAMPRIGAGLGGADWDEIKQLLCRVNKDSDIVLVICESYIPDVTLF